MQVCGVIDHHSLKTKTVCTAGPIFIDIRPWGSACSILAFDFFAAERLPSKPVAGMLLSGILSDTLNLKGPTTTEPDRVMVAALAKVLFRGGVGGGVGGVMVWWMERLGLVRGMLVGWLVGRFGRLWFSSFIRAQRGMVPIWS